MRQPKTHTVQSLKQRTIEVGDCWEWQGYYGNGTPQVSQNGKMQAVRRVFTELLGGQIKKGYYIPKCRNNRCVNPDHTAFNDPKTHLTKIGKVALKSPTRRLKIQIHKRKTISKLTQEIADVIRVSDDNSRVLAEKYGVNKSVICRIKRGEAWVNLSNPFAGLIRT